MQKKIKLTGKKTDKNLFSPHCFIGGFEAVSAGELRSNNPRKLIESQFKACYLKIL